ncbi:metabotropic glutamate receptor, partial [Eurytemora carolleeae]|uniref:metabotropic glutamate receptor n=1 Tax=Eurytemora carolleeae TaxID=1294199 RepID=UPI000C7696A3
MLSLFKPLSCLKLMNGMKLSLMWKVVFLVLPVVQPTYVSVGTRIPGDFVLGGLFPVHEKSEVTGQPCSRKLYNRGVQRMEAMLFAVDKINNDTNLLNNITLGVNIQDTCSRDTFALNQSLEFIRSSLNNLEMASQYECEKGGAPKHKLENTGPVLGVIGGHYSSVSLQVANLLRLFRIPQISPASTAKALSGKNPR